MKFANGQICALQASPKSDFSGSKILFFSWFLESETFFSLLMSHMLYPMVVSDFRYVWEKVSGCPLSLNPPNDYNILE